MSHHIPIVTIVGRPNVGKSTLFNRLLGERRAITADLPGTTRDRIYAEAEWQGKRFTVVDTGGLTEARADLPQAVDEQVRVALAESDLILLLVAAPDGLTAGDRAVAALARRQQVPVVVVVNKVDNARLESSVGEFHRLGFDAVVPVSALHGRSTGDLADLIVGKTGAGTETNVDRTPSFTIVGRPNAGKSTLMNRLTDSEAAVTSEEPHTTRDVTERRLRVAEGEWRLLDTAGMAKHSRARPGIPYWSLLRTLRAIAEADVAVLLIDATEGPTLQDAHIASHILDSGTGLVIALNKWDQVEKASDVQERFFGKLRKRLPFLPSPPVVFLSALTGEKTDRLLRAVQDVYAASGTRIPTPELNRVVQTRLNEYAGGRRRARLFYLTQTGDRPPTFACFVNQPQLWKEPQRRHVAGVLREEFDLLGTAVRLDFRKRRKESA
ncbi:MAG: ribosome biogenesis GTPase Der [bacterium]|nr:ribosome biogenesis GTPase Der [bacterium]